MTRSSNVTTQYLLEIETAVPSRTVWRTSVNVLWIKLEHIDAFIEFVLSCYCIVLRDTIAVYLQPSKPDTCFVTYGINNSLNILCWWHDFVQSSFYIHTKTLPVLSVMIFLQTCACPSFDVYATQCRNNGIDAANWREIVAFCRKLLLETRRWYICN